jgi:hypothetical protein
MFRSLTIMDQPTPKPTAPSPGAMPEEYLTIAEAAARLKLAPKTLRNKMAAGVFRKGVHYVRPNGLGTRFKWGAIVAWLEQEESETPEEGSIPMARRYLLGVK